MEVVLPAAVGVVGGTAGWIALRCGGRRGRVGVAVALLALAVLLTASGVAVATDFRDADGVLDCSNCTTLQIAIGATFAFGAPLLVGLLVAAVLQVVVETDGLSRR